MEEGVEDDREPRQVAEVLKEAENGVKGEDIGQNHDHGDVQSRGEHAETLLEVNVSVHQPADDDVVKDAPSAENTGEVLYHGKPVSFEERIKKAVDESFTGVPDGGEARGDDRDADDESPEGVHGGILELVQEGVMAVAHFLDLFRNRPDGRPSFLFRRRNLPSRRGFVQAVEKAADPFSGDGYGGDHRNPQKILQQEGVDVNPLVPGFVHHVEGDDHGKPALHDLEGEEEVPFQGRGIQNHHHGIALFGHHPFGHLFSLVGGGEGVGSGDVDDSPCFSSPAEPSFQEAHRGSRVVRGNGMNTGDPGEEGTFPHVGVAHEKQFFSGRFTHGARQLRRKEGGERQARRKKSSTRWRSACRQAGGSQDRERAFRTLSPPPCRPGGPGLQDVRRSRPLPASPLCGRRRRWEDPSGPLRDLPDDGEGSIRRFPPSKLAAGRIDIRSLFPADLVFDPEPGENCGEGLDPFGG
ncbi:hypothetical protein SDC9_70541 [bioreactor metagenome]|uniref:Uncharacterized protein n=1 Tax=bioreactor metagenome TaxID=1076179 RepID=A0A644Y6I7_9ZZZZ